MSEKMKVVNRAAIPMTEQPEDFDNIVAMQRPVSRAEFDALAFELAEVKRLFFAILDEAAKED